LDNQPVFWLVRVQLLPGVAIVIGVPVFAKFESQTLTFPEPDSLDFDVSLFFTAENAKVSETVLSHLFNSLEESSDQVGSHEWHGDFVTVLVLAKPQGVVFLVVFLPEVVHGGWNGVVVRVAPLPGVEVVFTGFGNSEPWVLGFLGGGGSGDGIVGAWGGGGFLLRGSFFFLAVVF
jgi:hypothetical protein